MGYRVSAEDVLAHAIRIGAERVCFYDDGFTFAEPKKEPIAEALALVPSGRYKLQSKQDGKWTDISKYARIFEASKLLSELALMDFSEPVNMPSEEVALAGKFQAGSLHSTLRRIFYDTVDHQLKNPKSETLGAVCEYFEEFSHEWSTDEHFNYFLTYLQLLREAFENELLATVNRRHNASDDCLMDLLLARFYDSAATASAGSIAASRCILGQVESLWDRDSAAKHFEVLRQEGHSDLVRFFYWDMGALTYYSSNALDMPALQEMASEISDSIISVSVTPTTNEVGVGISMDPAFFRIYAGWLYFYAQQLPDVDFNLFICASDSEAGQLVDDGNQFVAALSNLNRVGTPNNIHVYRIPTPSYVEDAKTFYACARFFTFETLLSRYPSIYLMDADLYLEDNPAAFFRQIKDVPFAAPETTGAGALAPWRRHMAGNVCANVDARDSTTIGDLQAYIVHGLHQQGSWMLDQNALTFAAERSASNFVSLNQFRRPFVASKFMRTWEANYWKSIAQ